LKRPSVLAFLVAPLLLVGTAGAADSLNVRLVAHLIAPNIVWGVAVSGDYAYLACTGDTVELRVVSVADPAHPIQVGQWLHSEPSGSEGNGVVVEGNYAFLSDMVDGLFVISVADPAHPAEVGHLAMPGYSNGVAVSGNYAYVADDTDGLRVVSIADPAHPVEVGHCETTGAASGVTIVGNLAYLADADSGLRVISVADPAHPVEVGRCESTGTAVGVAVNGEYAYVLDDMQLNGWLWVVSVADSAHPALVGGGCILNGVPNEACAVGNYVYTALSPLGLEVISVADPAHPVEAGYYAGFYGGAPGVTVAGGFTYLANGADGLKVYQFYGDGIEESPGPQASSHKPSPTIVRGVLQLGVDSRPKTGYRAELLNTTGRKVLDLRPGSNYVRALAPGVYFVRQASSVRHQASSVSKVVLTE